MKKINVYRISEVLFFALFILMFYGSSKDCPILHKNRYHFEIIENDSQWEYIIYKNQKPYIYQTCVPAVNVHRCFKDKREASLVGSMVVDKLEKGANPSVTVAELKKLHLYD